MAQGTRRGLLAGAAVAAGAWLCRPIGASAQAGYVCPPCGCPDDGRVFDKPGVCPSCKMTLVPASAVGSAPVVENGSFEVVEDRRDPASRKITLHYRRWRSTAARPANPIVYLAGGPGVSGIADAGAGAAALFQAMAGVGDVIALDQRGTGLSNAIPPCPAAPVAAGTPDAPLDLRREAMVGHMREELVRCWTWWRGQGVAMGGYTIEQSAHDVEDLRRALGVEKINLAAVSYGTHLALAVLRLYPQRVDRVALGSLVGLELVKRPAAVDEMVARIGAQLAADPATASAYPDLSGLVRRVHDRLDRTPATVTVNGAGGAPDQTVIFDGFLVRMIGGQLMKHPQTWAQAPAFYKRLDAGQHQPFVRQVLGMIGAGQAVSGMPEAVRLSSGVSPARLAEVEAQAKTALLGDAMSYPMPHLRGAIPGIELAQSWRDPFRVAHPALLIAGDLDGVTPLAEQRQAAAMFDKATAVTLKNGGHDTFVAPVAPLVARFFAGEAITPTTIELPAPRFAV